MIRVTKVVVDVDEEPIEIIGESCYLPHWYLDPEAGLVEHHVADVSKYKTVKDLFSPYDVPSTCVCGAFI